MQISFDLNAPVIPDLTVGAAEFGRPFFFVTGDHRRLFMRVKPVNFLTNSNLLNDIFSRGDALVVGLATGTLSYKSGGLEIEYVAAELRVKK